jgi:RNA polymerase sigma factor (sigma-70 family)
MPPVTTAGRMRLAHTADRVEPAGMPDAGLAALVCAARRGDDGAWTALVGRFDGRVRAIARSYRLSPADVDDVAQATWLHLLEDIDKLREPAAIGAWLATATRRAALRSLQGPVREQPTADPYLGDRAEPDQADRDLLAAERSAVVSRALDTLPDRHRRLMRLLLTQQDPDYRKISTLLDMPLGSIGPIRGRCLQRLQRHPDIQALRHA